MIIDLSGPQGNALAVLSLVTDYLIDAGQSDRLRAFSDDALSGDYQHLLDVCQTYCPSLAYRHRPAHEKGE